LSCADCDSGSSPAPAAELPPPIEEETEEDDEPPAALEPLEEFAPGHEQFADGEDDAPFTEPLTELLALSPWTFVWSGQVHDAEGAEPLDVWPADTPLFGLTLTLLSVLVCAKAAPNMPITAAAVRLTANFLAFMVSPFGGELEQLPASAVPR
jgi:hypothetical protein